jgi:hypothetical protein
VRGDAGAQPTYGVVTDELVAAAQAMLRVTDQAAAATVEKLPTRVFEVGQAGLATAFRDFCARWDAGLSHLVGDSAAMATRLDDCSTAYLDGEDAARSRYEHLTSCAPPPLYRQSLVYLGGL